MLRLGLTKARPSAGLHVLLSALLAVCCGVATPAQAEGRNGYGAKGRTVVSGGLWAERGITWPLESRSRAPTHALGLSATAVHFVVDNFALGGTLLINQAQVAEGRNPSSWLSLGADLDAIGHVPMSRRLSLRFWFFAGLRSTEYRLRENEWGIAEDRHYLAFRTGISPKLLVHLSESVALTFGPHFDVNIPVKDADGIDWEWGLGPQMSYSIGPAQSHGSLLEDARLFAARGRVALTMYGFLDAYEASTSLGFVRFVAQGIGLGAYAGVGYDGRQEAAGYANVGVQLMADVPVATHLSVLIHPQLGYAWQEVLNSNFERTDFPVSHSARLGVPVYLAVHCNEALVMGVGPALEVRASATQSRVSGGAASVITASF